MPPPLVSFDRPKAPLPSPRAPPPPHSFSSRSQWFQLLVCCFQERWASLCDWYFAIRVFNCFPMFFFLQNLAFSSFFPYIVWFENYLHNHFIHGLRANVSMSTPVVIHQSTGNCRFGDTNVSLWWYDTERSLDPIWNQCLESLIF